MYESHDICCRLVVMVTLSISILQRRCKLVLNSTPIGDCLGLPSPIFEISENGGAPCRRFSRYPFHPNQASFSNISCKICSRVTSGQGIRSGQVTLTHEEFVMLQ